LNYPTFNLADGIRHLQFEGVRYFLAVSPQVEADARQVPGLVKIASAPGFPGSINKVTAAQPVWDLYLIKGGGAPLVTPLDALPVVEEGTYTPCSDAPVCPAGSWLDTNLTWWETEGDWPVELALTGPANWPRVAAGTLVPPSRAVSVKPTTVTDVRITDTTISFDVGRLGAPVLVKVPYFPNWQASGALGPYDVSPNLMAVVPTAHHVTLTYGTTGADQVGKLASLGGAVGLGMLVTMRPPPVKQVVPAPGPEPGPSPASPRDDDADPAMPWSDDEDEPADTASEPTGLYDPFVPPPAPTRALVDEDPLRAPPPEPNRALVDEDPLRAPPPEPNRALVDEDSSPPPAPPSPVIQDPGATPDTA
jgi:hypothetical protein